MYFTSLMLYGCKALHLHTDHQNLTYTQHSILNASFDDGGPSFFLEEYNPIFSYIKDTLKTLADALLWLPCFAWQSGCSWPVSGLIA